MEHVRLRVLNVEQSSDVDREEMRMTFQIPSNQREGRVDIFVFCRIKNTEERQSATQTHVDANYRVKDADCLNPLSPHPQNDAVIVMYDEIRQERTERHLILQLKDSNLL